MLKCFTMRLKELDYDKMKVISEEQNRSMNKQIETILQQFIRDYEKVNGEIDTGNVQYRTPTNVVR